MQADMSFFVKINDADARMLEAAKATGHFVHIEFGEVDENGQMPVDAFIFNPWADIEED